ncbi:(Fe-S)-binding protein [Verrucomicrobiaceae bacterium 227]
MANSLKALDFSVLQQCMHCGMCLPTCPTYDATLRERHSPRGRISLMRAIAEDELSVNQAFADEMSYCLGCLACQSACPAGVDYAELFETSRAEIESAGINQSTSRSFWRWLTLEQLFMNPRLLRGVGKAFRFYQKSGVESVVRRVGLLKLLPKNLRRLEPQTPRMSPRFSDELIEEVEQPSGEKKHRVALLTGCVQDLAFAQINRDTADVLLANNCEVMTPPLQPCCGSLHGHNGEPELARENARRLMDLIDPDSVDAIISNAGGCGSHLRHYAKLLPNDPRAKVWDAKLKDVHEFLAGTKLRAPAPLDKIKVTYHDSCHLAHGQKVTLQPRAIIDLIPGVERVDLPESDWCCGSAGVYSITQPEQSGLLLDRKVEHIRSTGASVLLTANPGCHLQIANALPELKVMHPISLLAQAYRS